MINNKEVIKSGRSVTLARCKAMSRRTKISGKRPLCEVSVFAAYTVANQQALLQRQAESAAVVQRLYMGVKQETLDVSEAMDWLDCARLNGSFLRRGWCQVNARQGQSRNRCGSARIYTVVKPDPPVPNAAKRWQD